MWPSFRKTIYLSILIPLFTLLCFTASAQGIRGTIRNSNGEPLPYSSIYVENRNDGASANASGEYEIKLPPGKHSILVQYIGYEPQQLEVEIGREWVKKDFRLQEQAYLLQEVEVKGKAEDPAYTIMRKTIAKRKFHRFIYDSYEAKVYMKGTGKLTKAPFFLKNKLKEEGVKVNETYTTESVSEISFEHPGKFEEKVISIRSSGNNDGFPSPTIFIHQGFYTDKVADVISPLARTAFSYYKFRYEGSFHEGGLEINKIKVTPRSRGEQVFEGYIYIIENQWAIHSLDLSTSIRGFKVDVQQNYAEVAPKVWMPVTHQYLVSGSMMGFAGNYKYLASASYFNIVLNKDLSVQTEIIDEKVEEVPEDLKTDKPKGKDEVAETLAKEDKMTRKQFRKAMEEYEKEALKEKKDPEVIMERGYVIDSLARKRDSSYWDTIRPVPLTQTEKQGYQRDDSIAQVQAARLSGKDSANLIPRKKFKPTDLISGGNYDLSPRTNIRLFPTFTLIHYNTVEGLAFNMKARFRHEYDSLRKRFEFTPTLRYGLASEDFYAKGELSQRIKKGEHTHTFSLDGGKFIAQFNEDEPIHPHINSLSTLLFRKNYMKIYEKTYARGEYSFNAASQWSISTSLEWARRNELFNREEYSFFYSDTRTFSSNRPYNAELAHTGFTGHDALLLEAELSYRPGLKYRIYNGRKIPLRHRSPELLLRYKKGIPDVLGSTVDFDQLELGLNHRLSIGVRGKLEFELLGGTFLNSRSMYFMDYQHFDGNRTILSPIRPAGAFRLLDYYQYSTSNNYFSAHTHYQFRKFLLTQIPEVSFTGLRENIFFNYLKTDRSPHYWEVGYSIDQIMRIFRVEVAASFNDLDYRELGLRIGVASFLRFGGD